MKMGLVLVSGLARCGTSLMMQMLSAGGWPVFDSEVATWPGFEHPIALGDGGEPRGDGLLKWLDPQRVLPPVGVRGSILLRRNSKQQAKSHLKFLSAVGVPVGGADWRKLAASFDRDLPLAHAELSRSGPVFGVTFEALVADPRRVLGDISRWIGRPLDLDAAASQMRARPTGGACLPYLLEAQLVTEPRATPLQREEPRR